MQHKPNRWQPGKRDILFLALVVTVITVLTLGSTERKTKPLPDDKVHRTTTSRAACMRCHGPDGVRPQPPRHTKDDQCLLCHQQPKGWVGSAR